MMRSGCLWIPLVCAAAATASLWTGCAGKKQTEIVVGVETQMRVPADIQTVRLNVNAGGPVVFDQVYPVYNGVVLLPQTLALVPGAQQSSITITVLGYKLPPDNPYFDTNPPASDPQTQILRRSVVQYAPSRIVYLGMPLRYPCYQVACGDSQTCVAGECVDATVDSSRLPTYSDDLVFGNSSTCFSVTSCFAAQEPAVVLDPTQCIFTLPGAVGSPSANDAGPFPLPEAQGSGINVRVQYEDLETEVLDLDPVEGFSVPDPTKPQTFQLPPGLCKLYIAASDPTMTAPHKIVSIGVTALCPSKAINQPLCASDAQDNGQLPDAAPGPSFAELARPKALLYMLVDDSADLGGYFGQAAFQKVMAVTLSDPIFQSVDVAFSFFPRTTACAQFPAPDVPFQSASSAKPMIAAALESQSSVTATLGTDQALGEAYATIMAQPSQQTIGAEAVVIVTGNNPELGNCVPSVDQNLACLPGIATYVVAVQGSSPPPTMTDVQKLLTGGGQYFDATTDANAANAFDTIAAALTTCTYVSTPGIDPKGVLSYVDPITLQAVQIQPLSTPASCATGSGWTINGSFVKVCGDACSALRNAVTERTLLAVFENVPSPDLPVFAQQTAQEN